MAGVSGYLATLLFGAAIGACELIGRYRDAPFIALRNDFSLAYVAVNAMAAVAAYAIIVRMNWTFGYTGASVAVVQAAVAGFGAMAFFRSSLFNVKVGATEVAVGPAILFQTLMFATDRAVDRLRGQARSTLAADIMSGVSFIAAKEALPNYCFNLMQNVPLEEQQNCRQLVKLLEGMAPSEMRDSDKSLSLGLMLMNVVGREVLASAVRSLGVRIQGPEALSLTVITLLQGVTFERALQVLVDMCFVMSRMGKASERAARHVVALRQAKAIGDTVGLDNSTRVTMLALLLQQQVGETVLLSALGQIGDSLRDQSTQHQAATIPKPFSGEHAAPREAQQVSSGTGDAISGTGGNVLAMRPADPVQRPPDQT